MIVRRVIHRTNSLSSAWVRIWSRSWARLCGFVFSFDTTVKGATGNIKGNGSGMGGMLFIFDSDDGFLYSSFLFNGFRVLRTRHWQQLVEFKSGGFISECHFYGSARSSRSSLRKYVDQRVLRFGTARCQQSKIRPQVGKFLDNINVSWIPRSEDMELGLT